jgi:beta-galactosidase
MKHTLNLKNLLFQKIFILALAFSLTNATEAQTRNESNRRKKISLNGIWQIAEGSMDKIPEKFGHTVVVPGLVDMAIPAFVAPGPKVANSSDFQQKDSRRDAFWYHRKFKVAGPIPEIAELTVGKAMFGTRVFLNGKLVGDHLPCFTRGVFDVKGILREGENDLVIRVGADRDAVSGQVESGYDKEKERFIPGIYDNVELTLTGSPHIVNVQAVPDIENKSVIVHSWVKGLKEPSPVNLKVIVREAKSHKVVGEATYVLPAATAGSQQTGGIAIPIRGCRLWSPEDPFLYELEVVSTADHFTTRFGMRTFRFDSSTGKAVLNGKHYFMLGSNITLYRFFEDSARGNSPWEEKWVRKLHQKMKGMHWNSLRYCIGFAPEMWYRIADEEGILIQDEYPIWYPSAMKPAALKSDILAVEFKEWMEERWNHPSVVIWDACNETYSPETGKAIQMVRGLDFSDRPWDNGWGEPVRTSDPDECHPYHFIFGPNQPFRLRDLANVPRTKAGLLIAQPYMKEKLKRKNPLMINEYGGIWLTREGETNLFSTSLYSYLLPNGSNVDQRRLLYGRTMAAITEFFRADRQAAGVLHFTSLGYSRVDGYTSDDWIDVDKLKWNPYFYKYVRDAFAPVGLMVDFWNDEILPGKVQDFPVTVINDLEKNWKGTVNYKLIYEGKIVREKNLPAEVPGFGTVKLVFTDTISFGYGNYQVVATLLHSEAGPVSSLRDFSVLTPQQVEDRRNMALGQPGKASSVADNLTGKADFAFDGDRNSKWLSEKGSKQWIAVDLGKKKTVTRVELCIGGWSHLLDACTVQVSDNGTEWKDVYKRDHAEFGAFAIIEVFNFNPTPARFVRLLFNNQDKNKVYSITEFAVYK